MFDRDNIHIYQNNKEIIPLSESELKADNYDFGSIIESYHFVCASCSYA